MSIADWIALAVALGAFVFALVLCAAAARGDDILATPADEDQSERVADAHLSEYRHRRDVRNGLGRAS